MKRIYTLDPKSLKTQHSILKLPHNILHKRRRRPMNKNKYLKQKIDFDLTFIMS